MIDATGGRERKWSRGRRALALLLLGLLLLPAAEAGAASHSDAPLVKQDPQVNLTDVYTFIGTKYNNPGQKVLNVIVHVRPFSEPGDGAIYDRFADDARYSIHITHPSTGRTNIRYDFRFSRVDAGYKNLKTILSYGLGTEAGPIVNVGDARQNYTQTYTVTKVVGNSSKVIGNGLLTPPPNVGKRTTPAYNDAMGRAVSGAATFDALDRYTKQTVYDLSTGEAVFAGPREDGFFADAPGIFDLLDPRILGNSGNPDGLGQDGNGVDGFKGYNVLAFAIQIPVDSLPTAGYTSAFADLANALPAVGLGQGRRSLRLGEPPGDHPALQPAGSGRLWRVRPGQPDGESALQRGAGRAQGQGQLQPGVTAG